MAQARRRSLLEDEDLHVLEKDESSGGDVCARCDCRRDEHDDDGCACGKCAAFSEFDST